MSLAIMLGDSITSLTLLVVTSSRTYLRSRRRCNFEQRQRRQSNPPLISFTVCVARAAPMTRSAEASVR